MQVVRELDAHSMPGQCLSLGRISYSNFRLKRNAWKAKFHRDYNRLILALTQISRQLQIKLTLIHVWLKRVASH